MSNGAINEAEIDVLLASVSAEERPRMRYILIGIGQLTTEVAAMRQVCEQRGRLCPAMHGNVADPPDPAGLRVLAAEQARGVVKTAQGVADDVLHTAEATALRLAADSQKTWAMWGVGTTLLREILLPLGVTILTLFVIGKL